MLDPHQLPESLNLTQFFLHAQADRMPEKTALIFEGQRLSYRHVQEQVRRVAGLFRALEIQPEQRVLLMLPDVPQFAYAWFGAVQMGAVVSAASRGAGN